MCRVSDWSADHRSANHKNGRNGPSKNPPIRGSKRPACEDSRDDYYKEDNITHFAAWGTEVSKDQIWTVLFRILATARNRALITRNAKVTPKAKRICVKRPFPSWFVSKVENQVIPPPKVSRSTKTKFERCRISLTLSACRRASDAACGRQEKQDLKTHAELYSDVPLST